MPNSNVATREVFWNVSPAGEVLFFLLAAVAVGTFAYGFYVQVRRIRRGRSVTFSLKKAVGELGHTLAQLAANRTVFRRHTLAGVLHAMIMWGFITLFIGTLIVGLEDDVFRKLLGLERGFWYGSFFLGYELVLDTLGALFVLGLLVALVRRYALHPPQLNWHAGDLLLPVWLVVIALTGFAVEAARLAATGATLAYDPLWSPVGFALSKAFRGMSVEGVRSLHWGLWWFHAALVLGWIAHLPYAPKVGHILSAALNVFLKDLRPQGRLERVDVEAAFEHDRPLGVETLDQLTRKDTLDLFSCTECGRCDLNCPANLSGKLLSPRAIVTQLRAQAQAERPAFGAAKEARPVMEASIPAEAIWACTTCMACVEACPVFIDPLNKILELRRNEVMSQDRYPETFAELFWGVEKRGNPWNQHPSARLDWAKGLELKTMSEVERAGERVDYLFWVGCSAAFDPRNQKIARSLVRVLQAAGASFSVLGEEETCTGDPARRIGHEYLYQIQAEMNVETLNRYPFKTVVTLCPHCFNTIKNEYPDFGGSYDIVHHTELIKTLLDQGKLKLAQPVERTVVYHDACYLGRHNQIYDPPRDILKRLPGLELLEIERSRERGMCCGAGGGQMWLEEEPGQRVNERRVEQAQRALGQPNSKPATIASACPFCMTMLEDGVASQGAELQDKDIAELVAEALGVSE